MALILSTANALPDLSQDEILQVYNGLDCCITHQIHSGLLPLLRPHTSRIYAFESNLLRTVAMEMMLRGIRVDTKRRDEIKASILPSIADLRSKIDRLAAAFWNKGLNPDSPAQLKDLLYNVLGLPIQYTIVKKERKPTTNREALENLQHFFWAGPLIRTILAWKDEDSKLNVLNAPLESDGRMRFNFNVGATETGRWSSSKNAFGRGTNGQNITDELREIFIPDPGKVFINIDAVSGESFVVGFVARDWKYVEACESGDLHTLTAKMLWPELDWGERAHWREVADRIFYRHFSYRDLSKRGGHLSNYVGKPPMMRKHLHIPLSLAQEFQDKYFAAFPQIPVWHIEVAAELQTTHTLITPMGRERQFYGRPDSHDTLKEAVAFVPQSTLVDIVNEGALRIWKKFPFVEFLSQGHDALLMQIPIELLHLAPALAKEMEFAVPVSGRDMTIPMEVSIGWNWGKAKKENPLGLRKWGKDVGSVPPEAITILQSCGWNISQNKK